MSRWPVLTAIALLGAVAVGWFAIGEAGRQRQLASGSRVYADRCASCHGKNLEGQKDWQTPLATGRLPAPPHDATGHTWHHSDQELFLITKDGMAAVVPDYESDMPGFAGVLSDDEIIDVIAFMKSTWPEKERAYQAARDQ